MIKNPTITSMMADICNTTSVNQIVAANIVSEITLDRVVVTNIVSSVVDCGNVEFAGGVMGFSVDDDDAQTKYAMQTSIVLNSFHFNSDLLTLNQLYSLLKNYHLNHLYSLTNQNMRKHKLHWNKQWTNIKSIPAL